MQEGTRRGRHPVFAGRNDRPSQRLSEQTVKGGGPQRRRRWRPEGLDPSSVRAGSVPHREPAGMANGGRVSPSRCEAGPRHTARRKIHQTARSVGAFRGGGKVQPETRFARLGEDRIAYQVLGNGPPDLVLTPGSLGHLDIAWEDPGIALFCRTLASCCRLILLDRRGTAPPTRCCPIPFHLGSRTPRTWPRSWTRSAPNARRCWPSSTPARRRSSSPRPNQSAPAP